MSGPLTSVAIGCSGMMETMTIIMMRKSSGKSQRQAKSRARRSAMEECGQGSQVTMAVGREVLIRLAWRTAQFVIEESETITIGMARYMLYELDSRVSSTNTSSAE